MTKTNNAEINPKCAPKNAVPQAANNNQRDNNYLKIAAEFNLFRGQFLSEFTRFEILLCETLFALKNNTEILKADIPNTNAHRTDLMLTLSSEDNKLKSKIGQIKIPLKEIEKYENLRNFLAHGASKILRDESGKYVCMLLIYANNGQSNRKEVEFIEASKQEIIVTKLKSLVNNFENHTKSIRNLWIAS